MTNPFLAACELKRKLATALFLIALFAIPAADPLARPYSSELRRDRADLSAGASAKVEAAYGREGGQEHPPTPAPAGQAHAAEGEHAAPHSVTDMILAMGWPIANFIIFVGVLYYFFNQPLKDYLASRSSTIRKDLVEAAELKAAATAQLATIEQKLQALPGELDALRKRGAAEIAAEEQRIAAAAVADRDRLLEQTRREIDLQVRLAKREILEHAADLSVQLATERIKKEVTPADQDGLSIDICSRFEERITKNQLTKNQELINVPANFGQSVRESALRRRAGGEERPGAGRPRPRGRRGDDARESRPGEGGRRARA